MYSIWMGGTLPHYSNVTPTQPNSSCVPGRCDILKYCDAVWLSGTGNSECTVMLQLDREFDVTMCRPPVHEQQLPLQYHPALAACVPLPFLHTKLSFAKASRSWTWLTPSKRMTLPQTPPLGPQHQSLRKTMIRSVSMTWHRSTYLFAAVWQVDTHRLLILMSLCDTIFGLCSGGYGS